MCQHPKAWHRSRHPYLTLPTYTNTMTKKQPCYLCTNKGTPPNSQKGIDIFDVICEECHDNVVTTGNSEGIYPEERW